MNKLLIQVLSMFLALEVSMLHAVGPSNCGTNLARLVVGSDFGNTSDLGYLPFEQNDNGQILGFDAAVACELAQRLGFAGVSFQQDDFPTLLSDLVLPVSQFDIVISALSVTESRINDNPKVGFVKYNEDSLGIVFNVADVQPQFINPTTVLQTLNQLSGPGKTIAIGVTQGSREITLLNAYPNLDIVPFTTVDLAVAALENVNNDVFALFVDGATAVALAEGDEKLFTVNNVIATPDTAPSLGLGIAVPTECCQLYANIQQAVDDMNADGTLERLRAEFRVPLGFSPVPGLAPVACAGVKPNIASNPIANYFFSNYCEASCNVTALLAN